MSDFAPTLYQDFGVHGMKVWITIMSMRGEPKQVIDATFESISHIWNNNNFNHHQPNNVNVPSLNNTVASYQVITRIYQMFFCSIISVICYVIFVDLEQAKGIASKITA